ncbi:hypothetical protein D3C75_1280570 [compost metagenome]
MRSPGLNSKRTAMALTAPYSSACAAEVRAARAMGLVAVWGSVMPDRLWLGSRWVEVHTKVYAL